VSPSPAPLPPAPGDGRALLAWLGERDRRGLERLRSLLAPGPPPVAVPLLPRSPADLQALTELGETVARGLGLPG
jgi:hypothetical protein